MMKQYLQTRTVLFAVTVFIQLGVTGSSLAQNGTWVYKTPLPYAVQNESVVQLNEQIYVIGGYCNTNTPRDLNSVEVYDPASNSWTARSPKPTPGHGLSAGVINGLIYVAGSPDQETASLEVYNPANDSWTAKTPPPVPLHLAGHAVVNGKLYLIGGNSYGWQQTDTLVYDPATDSWQFGAATPNIGCGTCCACNGKIYAVESSYNGQPWTGMVSVYDPSSDAWTGKTSMPTAYVGTDVETVNGLIYAIGGGVQGQAGEPTTNTNLLQIYNPVTDSWTNGPSLLEPVGAIGTCVLNGSLYAVGGINITGQSEISDVEALIPYSPGINLPTIITNIAVSYGLQAVNPALNRIYLGGGQNNSPETMVLDGGSFSLITTVAGWGASVDLTNNDLWTANVYSGSVSVYDTNNETAANVSLNDCPIGVSVDSAHRVVWVEDQCGDFNDPIWAVNADTHAVLAGPLGSGGVNGGPIQANPVTGRFYFTSGNTAKEVNSSTYAITTTDFGFVIGINASENLIYSVGPNNTLQIVNGGPYPEVVETNVALSFAVNGGSIGVNPGLNRIYVGNSSSNNIAILNASSGQNIGSISLGAGITGVQNVLADPTRNRVYATASGASTTYLYVIQDALYNPPTLTNIVVSPANSVVGTGSNLQFAATGYYSDGSSQILTNGGGWVAIAGMPGAKLGAACAALNGNFYALAGDDTSDNDEPFVYDYSPTTGEWSVNSTSVPGPYCYAGATGIGNNLYFFGGAGGCDSLNTGSELYVYNGSAWTNGSSMPYGVLQMGVGVIDGKIYVAGGANGRSDIPQGWLQVYDPASNTWTTKHALPAPLETCGAVGINGKLYVVGGSDSSGAVLGSLLVYDPTTDTWATNAPMPTPRTCLGVATVGGLLYAISGQAASGVQTNLVEVYNPVTDSWSAGAPTLTAHYQPQPVVINGTIYLAGNGPNNTAITNAEAFGPQSLVWSSSNPNVASIDSNGVVTSLTNGVTTITATSGTESGSTLLTVVPPGAAPPSANTLTVPRLPGQLWVIPLSALATNWSDAAGLPVELTAVSSTTTNGQIVYLLGLTTNPDGSYAISDSAFIGYDGASNVNDQISYTISDGLGGTATGYVNFVVSTSPLSGQAAGISNPGPGGVTLNFAGIPGYLYGVQRSTNLISWATLWTTNAPPDGLFNFLDTFGDLGGTAPSSAYYRLTWNP